MTVGAAIPPSRSTRTPSLTPSPAGAKNTTYPHNHEAAKAPATVTKPPASGASTAKEALEASAATADQQTGINQERRMPGSRRPSLRSTDRSISWPRHINNPAASRDTPTNALTHQGDSASNATGDAAMAAPAAVAAITAGVV